MKKYKFTIHGNQYEVHIQNVEDNIIELEVNGSHYTVEVDKSLQPIKTPKLVRARAVPSTDTTPSEGTGTGAHLSKGTGTIKAPLPGTILSIHCKVGDMIKVGQKLIVLEAMKMENNIDSDKEGRIIDIKVSQGKSVMEGDVLIEIGG
jgi:glutaconyl-CoA/methylmalonyl-CoA decarboxylase subunit gamma